MKILSLRLIAVLWILTLVTQLALATERKGALSGNACAEALYLATNGVIYELSQPQMQALQAAQQMKVKNVSSFAEFQFIMGEALRRHVAHKELTQALTRDLLDSFINKLDPTGLVLFDSDRKKFVGAGQREEIAGIIFEQIKKGDVSHFAKLVALYDHRLRPILRDLSLVRENRARERLLAITRKQRSEHFSKRPQDNLDQQKTNLEYALSSSLPMFMQADQMEFDDAIQVVAHEMSETFQHNQLLPANERLYVLLAHAFIACLDAHSRFLTQQEAEEEFETGEMSPYRAIGVTLSPHPRGLIVATVAPDSIAEKSGLKSEDLILLINNKSLAKADQMDFRRIWSKESSDSRGGYKKAKLHIQRGDNYMLIELDPNNVLATETSQVRTERLATTSGDMLYIQFPMFYQNAGQEMRRKVLTEIKKSPIKGVILDLRFNGGGRLDEATDIFSIFTQKDEYSPIWYLWDGNQITERGRREYVRAEGVLNPYPLVIMINGASASASELVSGALKGIGRAVIVGTEQSFGKGTAQGPAPFLMTNTDGSQYLVGMSMLTEHFFYSAGRPSNQNGESPQFNGVKSHIILGGRQYDRSGELERDMSFALKPPEVTPQPIQDDAGPNRVQQARLLQIEQMLPQLRANHEARIMTVATEPPRDGETNKDNLRKQALDILADIVGITETAASQTQPAPRRR